MVGVVLCIVVLPAGLKRRLCLPRYKEIEHLGCLKRRPSLVCFIYNEEVGLSCLKRRLCLPHYKEVEHSGCLKWRPSLVCFIYNEEVGLVCWLGDLIVVCLLWEEVGQSLFVSKLYKYN